MQIVIPMAGEGSRFAQAGYSFPKPLIPTVNDLPMISLVTENLLPADGLEDIEIIYICQKSHYEKYDLENVLARATKGVKHKVVQIDQKTEGAACTVLMAADLLNTDEEIVIANSDQIIGEESMDLFYDRIRNLNLAQEQARIGGAIMTFKANHPKWSYARLNSTRELVTEVAEKKVISDYATTGIYWFKHGKDFVRLAGQMIKKDIRVNGEFYIAPVFNELILENKEVVPIEIKQEDMHGIGTPEDLSKFLGNL